jgi:hypothetical protein
VLRIFTALKNPSPPAGFEPLNFETNGKHANHYTTEGTVTSGFLLSAAEHSNYKAAMHQS